ncbi:MAG: hypothetical protein IH851_06475, partial [Armatimonadetes bacterium]|nr:hypothetical protein [Armatimonadota bacterium]
MLSHLVALLSLCSALLPEQVGTARKLELVVQTGHSGAVTSVAFSPDGKILASGSTDGTIKLWHTATGRQLRTLSGIEGDVTSVAFNADGKQLVSGSWFFDTGRVTVWDIDSGRRIPLPERESE